MLNRTFKSFPNVTVFVQAGLVLGVLLFFCLCKEASQASARECGNGPADCASAQNICTANSIHSDGRTSHLCLKVRLEDGQPKVDRDQTCVFLTAEFTRRLGVSKLSVDQVKKILFDRVDGAFSQSDKLIYYALTPDQQKTVRDNGCQALMGEALAGTRALCEMTGPWEPFITAYATWKETAGHPTPDFDRILYNKDVEAYLKEIDFDSSLNFADPLGDAPTYDGSAGLLLLRVADPISDWRDPEYRVCISDKCDGKRSDEPRSVAAPDEIREALRPLNGHLWNQSEIKALVQEYYSGKGLLATVDVNSPFSDDGKVVRIKESPRLLSINFPIDTKASLMDKALYLLLPDSQFRRFIKCRDDFTPQEASPLMVVDIKRLLRKGTCSAPEDLDTPLPYLNLIKLQLQKLQLNAIDLDVAVGTTTDEGEEYVFLQVAEVEKADKEGKETTGENDKAAALPNDEGRVDTNLAKPETQNSFVPRVTIQPTASPSPTPSPSGTPASSPRPTPSPDDDGGADKKKRNYVGGGFEYRSGQGIKVFGIYQRTHILFGDDGLSVQIGGQDQPLGSLSYYADYVGFGTLHRKVTLQFTGSSELNAQRLFSGLETNERRTGMLARAEIELFRDRGGSLMRFFLEGQRMTVELNQKNTTVAKQNLSTLDFGALYLLQPDYQLRYPRWARVEPRLRLGLGLASTEPRFNTFSLSGNFHQKLPAFFEMDVNGRLSFSSLRAPIFEQASLGGTESVRGFRQDEAIGRRLWSLQSELWIPLPGTTKSAADFQRFLLRSVRISAFADVGGISKTIGSAPGTRFGPGVGMRFIFNPIVIKLDWAYGLTSADPSTGKGRFSFGIVSNLPF